MTYKEIFVELRNITTINLACKSTNWLERLLWYLIGLIGTLWAIYFITQQVCRKLCDLDQSGHLESGTKVNCNKKLAIASIMAELAFLMIFITIIHIFLKVISWEASPSVLIRGNIETTDLKYPAVTVCPKVSTRYGIAERLGNYIDPSNLPKELLSVRHEYFMCATGLLKKSSDYSRLPKESYHYHCIQNREKNCKV